MSLDNTIPKGWNKSNIGELCNVYIGGDILKKHFSKYKTQKFKYPIYSNGTGKNALYGYSDICVINSPCITVTARGSIGYCLIHNEPIYPIIRLIVLTSKQIFLPYLKYFLDYINIEASSAGIPQLTAPMIKQLQILYPAYNEQVKIVNVLKNIDKLIYNLEILIKKKEYIKKGLMQELLTYKTVIKNYDNIFITTSLGQLSLINTGDKNNEDKVVNGRYPFFVRSNQIMKINTYSYDGEAILVAGDGNIGEVYHYYVGKFDYHQRVYKISNFKNCDGKFIFYFMQLFFKATAIKNTAKATVNSLRMDTFKNFVLTMPKSINEQKAIANIISNVDNEIMSLNNKLYKYKQIKQGLMEELLTGKKRL